MVFGSVSCGRMPLYVREGIYDQTILGVEL